MHHLIEHINQDIKMRKAKASGPYHTTFQSSVKIISYEMYETTFKLVITQRQYVDLSY